MRPADTWKDYELLDATDGNRLERWGETLLIRPDPQVVWKTPKQSPLWAKADAIYHRSNQGGGEWEYRRRLPEKWKISCGEGEDKLTLIVSPTGFKHTGVFPEQAVNWAWYQQKIRAANRPVKVLNSSATPAALRWLAPLPVLPSAMWTPPRASWHGARTTPWQAA